MAVTLDDLAAKGKRKYRAKISAMRASFRAAKTRAQSGYDATPFGPTRKANYKKAWEYMPDNYDLIVKEGLEDRWADRWKAKMAE